MQVVNIENKILSILQDIGIFIDDYEPNLDLREYITDSIQFITFIVEIEKAFEIEVPDEMLLFDSLMSLTSFTQMIGDIIDN